MKVWQYDSVDNGIRVFSNECSALKTAIKDYSEAISCYKDLCEKLPSFIPLDQIKSDLISLIEKKEITDICYIYELEVED